MCGVFYHSVIQGLGFFICFMIEIMKCKTIKHAFSLFSTLIEHGFVTYQSTCRVLSILSLSLCGWSTIIVRNYFGMLLTQNITLYLHNCPSKVENMFQVCPSVLLTIFTARYFWLFHADFEVQQFAKYFLLHVL